MEINKLATTQSPADSQAVVLMGGTFDPVHIGHLITATSVADRLGVNRISLVPCYQSPFKQGVVPIASHRLKMLEVAVENDSRISIDTRELERAEVSYTIDTIRSVRAQVGMNRPCVLVLGQDAWESFAAWRDWQEILKLTNIAVCDRMRFDGGRTEAKNDDVASSQPQQLADYHAEHTVRVDKLTTFAAGRIAMIKTPRVDVSSTDIRQRVKEGSSIRYWVTDPVMDYITTHQLYLNTPSESSL